MSESKGPGPKEALNRIAELERGGLNATIHFDAEIDVAPIPVTAGTEGPLADTPIAIKDNIATLDFPTTCGSRCLLEYQSPYEATAVSRLKAAGAAIVCKTNLDEFGMGSSTEHSAFGPCRHPEFPDRVPGGSSGGSAALVASGAVPVALGSETGGSVRQPASFCGVVGFKPTYGAVSRFGLVAFGSSLDHIGVMGTTSRMVASVMEVISGHDPLDSTSLDRPPLRCDFSAQDLDAIRIGIPVEFFSGNLSGPIRRACDRALELLRGIGASVESVSLPHVHFAVPTYYVIAPAEASANLARYDSVRYGQRVENAGGYDEMIRDARAAGFGAEVKRRIMVGAYVLSAGYYDAYYTKAQIARGLIARDFAQVFSAGVDMLFTPTCPTTAFKMGEHVDDPVSMYMGDQFVCPANLAGIPAISVPIGRTEGLPIGGQLIGPAGADASVLQVAALLESVVDAGAEV